MDKELERLIEKNGFILKRQSKHRVYQDSNGVNFVTANTPSDHRAQLNIRKELRRVTEKAGREFIEDDKKQRGEKVQQFNAPKIVVEDAKSKTLDDEGLRVAIEGRKNGWPLARICEALSSMGYRKSSGVAYSGSEISAILIKNGARKNNTRAVEAPTAPRKNRRSVFLQELTDLLTSNLAEDLKERMAIMLVQGHVGQNT